MKILLIWFKLYLILCRNYIKDGLWIIYIVIWFLKKFIKYGSVIIYVYVVYECLKLKGELI